MNTSSNCNGIDINYKIITPSKHKKMDVVNVETNTEPWLSTCQFCMEKDQIGYGVNANVDIYEYAKAIKYINSIHNFINESMIAKQMEHNGSNISLNSSFSMPDLPNFLTIFSNICGLNKQEKSQMSTKSTSTTTLLPLCEALKRYTEQEEQLVIEIQNQDMETQSEISKTSIPRYRTQTMPNYHLESLPKTLISDQSVNKSQNRLKLHDKDSSCSCSTKSSAKRSTKKLNLKTVVTKAPVKVDSHWKGNQKKYEYLFNKKFGNKIEKNGLSKDNVLSEAEIDLYATQLLSEVVGDCNNRLKKSQESHSKSETSNKQKLKIARLPLERKKPIHTARESKEKPTTAIPVKKRLSEKEKCKLKACNSENSHRTKSKRNLPRNWSVAQETKQAATFKNLDDSPGYTTLECSLLQDERQIQKFGRDHPIMSFELPSLTDIQIHSDNNREHKSDNGKSITSLPNHIAVALPHTQENNIFLTKKNIVHANNYIQSRLERQANSTNSSESMIMDDQDLENCTDSDICDDVPYNTENRDDPQTNDSARNQITDENYIEPFQQIRTFKNDTEISKFKDFIAHQRKKCLKYSNSISNDTISSDITSIRDLNHEIIIRKIN